MPVYIIRAGEHGPVKIGFAEDVRLRLTKMQADNHERLTVLRVLVGGQQEESELHLRFAAQRMRGEWFEFSPELLGDLGIPDEVQAVEATEPHPHPLGRYLQTAGTPIEEFAARIGVSMQAIYRYLDGERIPARDVMAKIVRATSGSVQPNDFYPVAA